MQKMKLLVYNRRTESKTNGLRWLRNESKRESFENFQIDSAEFDCDFAWFGLCSI
jgi:hypothetical protein